MLVNLHIVNIALIDELDIDFTEGLNVLTGETGAGKSIIIGSIGIGLGGRFDAGLLRDSEKDGLVELLFFVEDGLAAELEAEDIEVHDGEVLISRRLSGGRSVNRINDRTVTVAKLKDVAQKLISLHAQHEQRTLLKAASHLEIVDSYDNSIIAVKKEVAELYRDYKKVSDKLESLISDDTDRAKKLDYIRYEINSIESARLKPGEDMLLEELFKKASNSQQIAEITSEVMRLTGYDSPMSSGNQISEALQVLTRLKKYDDFSDELIGLLSDIEALMSDFSRELAEYASEMEYDEETLKQTSDRLDLINTLKSRYGSTIEEVLGQLASLKDQEEELASYDETIAKLSDEKAALEAELEKATGKLTEARKKTADALCKTIADAMRELNFNDVRFTMHFDEAKDYSANGKDIAEFYISTNIGEDIRPLTQVASGGELSRVMLAIKSVISETADTPTLIFDEIDVGISGITAEKVGNVMHRLGETRQIITITHLPQIAACADSSYVIEKEVVGDKTITGISRLSDEGRVMELARLLGGASVTDSVIATAREMLER